MTTTTTAPSPPDLAAIKQRQQAAWASGDYAVVGTTLQIVGERLCEAIDLRAGAQVLDVAAGNGNATLAAARRYAQVISTDYVGALLDRAGVPEDIKMRAVPALSLLCGIEAHIVLQDVCGLAPEEAGEVLKWAARALTRAAMNEAAEG